MRERVTFPRYGKKKPAKIHHPREEVKRNGRLFPGCSAYNLKIRSLKTSRIKNHLYVRGQNSGGQVSLTGLIVS